MRDTITINSTVRKIGNGYFIPIKKAECDLIGIDPKNRPDLIVEIEVGQRITIEQTDE